jgi:hypothetical protein
MEKIVKVTASVLGLESELESIKFEMENWYSDSDQMLFKFQIDVEEPDEEGANEVREALKALDWPGEGT